MSEDVHSGDITAEPFGCGEFPLMLDRLNWAALFFGPLWALFNRRWLWCIGLVSARYVPVLLDALFPSLAARLGTPAFAYASWALYSAPLIVFAFRANRLAWSAESKTTPGTVGEYLINQRKWALFGLVFALFPATQSLRDDYGALDLERVKAALIGVGVTAVVFAVLFAADRARSSLLARS